MKPYVKDETKSPNTREGECEMKPYVNNETKSPDTREGECGEKQNPMKGKENVKKNKTQCKGRRM